MIKLGLKQKIYNFLANVRDYGGFHFIANDYRNGRESTTHAIIDLLFIWSLPINILLAFVYTGRFHSPNCDCDRMKRLKKLYEKSNEEQK